MKPQKPKIVKTKHSELLFGVMIGSPLVVLAFFALIYFNQLPKSELGYTKCEGCGTEFATYDYSGKRIKGKRITKCPNCPLSDEEFLELQRQIRQELPEECGSDR